MTSDTLSLLLLAVALVLALLGLSDVLAAATRRDELRERALGEAPPSLGSKVSAALEDRFARTRPGAALAVKLQAAAIERTPLQFVGLTIALGLVAFVVLSLVFPVAIAVLGALGAMRLAFVWLERKREQRRAAFIAQLPELARLLSNGTSAGLGVNAALDIAVHELPDPASSELRVVREEVRIGSSFDAALGHLGERMPSRELGVLVSTLVVQQRAGGDLVSALADMSRTLEARKETLREVKTLMAGAVVTGYMVAGMGVAAVFLINLLKPGSLDALTKSAIGLLLVALATVMYLLAFFLIGKITKVDA